MSLFFLHCAGQLLAPSDEKTMSCLSSVNFLLFNVRFFKKTSPCFLFMRVLVLAGCPLCLCLFLSCRPSLCLTLLTRLPFSLMLSVSLSHTPHTSAFFSHVVRLSVSHSSRVCTGQAGRERPAVGGKGTADGGHTLGCRGLGSLKRLLAAFPGWLLGWEGIHWHRLLGILPSSCVSECTCGSAFS